MRTIPNPLSLLGGLAAASCAVLLLSPSLVDSKSILGIDLGSLYMKVALVRRNSPLEIVTNMHTPDRDSTALTPRASWRASPT